MQGIGKTMVDIIKPYASMGAVKIWGSEFSKQMKTDMIVRKGKICNKKNLNMEK